MMDTETLKRMLAEATPGPWEANIAHGEINGGVYGGFPVIEMNTETYDRASACVALDSTETANLRLIALAPALAAEVIELRAALARMRLRTAADQERG